MFLLKALATLQKKQTTPTGSLPPGRRKVVGGPQCLDVGAPSIQYIAFNT